MSVLRRILKRKGKRKVAPNDEDSGMNLGDLNPMNVPSTPFSPSTDSIQTRGSRISVSSHPSSSTSQPTLGSPPFAHEGPNTTTVVSKSPITADRNTESGISIVDDGDSKSTLREKRVLSGIGYASKTMEISKAVADTSDVLKPLKAACGITEKALMIAQQMVKNESSWNDLKERLSIQNADLVVESERLEAAKVAGKSYQGDRAFHDALKLYLQTVEKIQSEIGERSVLLEGRQLTTHLVGAGQVVTEAENIDNLVKDLAASYQFFLCQLARCIQDTASALQTQVKRLRLLNLLDDVNARGARIKPLTSGTRAALIARLRDWAQQTSTTEQIFWLRDEAGTGKTTLAAHMSTIWAEEGILAARFFFNRDDRFARNLDRFCFGIAKELSYNHPEAQHFILAVLDPHSDLENKPFSYQFKVLVIGVIARLGRLLGKSLVLVIDGLDECDPKGIDGLAHSLVEDLCSEQVIRALVTNRSLTSIEAIFGTASNVGGRDASLLDVKGKKRDLDVEIYVRERLEKFNILQQRIVIDCAEGVFLWASLACDAILQTLAPEKMITKLASMEPHDKLRQLYETVLDQALPDVESLGLMQVVLQGVVLTFQPVSIYTVQNFYRNKPKEGDHQRVGGLVERLASVMKDGTIYLPIYTLHPTFREFLERQNPNDRYYLAPPFAHSHLANACLDLITGLVGGIHLSPIARIQWRLDEDESPEPLSDLQDMPLRYVIVFWARHAAQALADPSLREKLVDFFQQQLLTWIEWSSVIREIPESINGLHALHKGIAVQEDEITETWCKDAATFLQRNSRLIEQSPRDIYRSALAFTPSRSLVHQTYFSKSSECLPILL
ncbi:hypothetical protein CPB86DRAFT_818600 [Serendipita vermifera]|nr:hypothetical protein CPB86DRAFT_818600 [Serendipita vermifera]